MRITISDLSIPASGGLAVGVLEGRTLTLTGQKVDKATDGALSRAIGSARFKGARGEILEIHAPVGLEVTPLLAVGLGKPQDLTELRMEAVGGAIAKKFNAAGVTTGAIVIDAIKGAKLNTANMAARAAYGAKLGTYRFDRYRTQEKPERKPSLKALNILTRTVATARKAYKPLSSIADGVILTRDLVSEPANVIYPKTLAQAARKLNNVGVKVEVLGRARLKQLGMGALLGVAQGSANEPQVVVMRWNGAPAKTQSLAFVGKGVTFDSGGISIKPSGGMEDMKWDMGGSGVVIGLMKALAARKAKVNVVGVVGLVENMPSGTAQRPGDIVTSMSGQTIEVINTDAEGRLVLADVLWYTQKRFKPKVMIDLATLTGAVIIALGDLHAGLFSNSDELCERLGKAGLAVGERVWRLPLAPEYDKLIDSAAADMKNVGSRGAGSITAAQFLQRFVAGVPWAHLDIAAVTWSKKDKPTVPKGGTGFGVRLLDRLVADYYEK
ncbi:MAG: leucyl aminopeptidase [Proteobacteria bacterium]|nr:leucyl aminopeptidase [Pseudomonadota bacterium]